MYAMVPSVEPGLVRCCSSITAVIVFAEVTWLEELAGATFANPKSRILACPRLVTNMLAGLMSR
jgi:hypothetical protein